MTEAEWLTSTDPKPMLEFITHVTITDPNSAPGDRRWYEVRVRKLRLFGCACCRLAWSSLPQEPFRAAVEVVEGVVDDRFPASRLAALWQDLEQQADLGLYGMTFFPAGEADLARALDPVATAERLAARLAAPEPRIWSILPTHWWQASAWVNEFPQHATYLRDIFGPLLFRPSLTIDPAWLTWGNGTVEQLAQAVYEERALPSGHLDPARLAVLADALLDAGCPQDHELLLHLRAPGPHVRGCIAVDRLTGRE
jgi:hypothetical protein